MGAKKSSDVRSFERNSRSRLGKLGVLVLRFARHRLVAYTLISLAIAGGFHMLEIKHRNELERAVYNNCVQQERIKAQANQRIIILKEAQRAVVFRTVKDRSSISKMIDRVQPLPAYDCEHLRPHN